MYATRHFEIRELVYPGFYEKFQTRGQVMFMAFDPRALAALDALRDRFGPCVVNDWAWGGRFSLSGLRPFDSGTGAALSQHIFGRAFDCKFKNITADEVRADLFDWQAAGRPDDHRARAYALMTRIEAFKDMSWFHFDTGNHDAQGKGFAVVGA